MSTQSSEPEVDGAHSPRSDLDDVDEGGLFGSGSEDEIIE